MLSKLSGSREFLENFRMSFYVIDAAPIPFSTEHQSHPVRQGALHYWGFLKEKKKILSC